MCSIIWLKLMLAAKDSGEVVKIVDVLGSCMYSIYEIVNAMSIDLCGVSSDIQY